VKITGFYRQKNKANLPAFGLKIEILNPKFEAYGFGEKNENTQFRL